MSLVWYVKIILLNVILLGKVLPFFLRNLPLLHQICLVTHEHLQSQSQTKQVHFDELNQALDYDSNPQNITAHVNIGYLSQHKTVYPSSTSAGLLSFVGCCL